MMATNTNANANIQVTLSFQLPNGTRVTRNVDIELPVDTTVVSPTPTYSKSVPKQRGLLSSYGYTNTMNLAAQTRHAILNDAVPVLSRDFICERLAFLEAMHREKNERQADIFKADREWLMATASA